MSVLCIWTIKTAWIQSLGDVGELTGRNGGVAKKQFRIRSTVRGTCTEAASVQESMWKLPNMAIGRLLLLPLITQSEMLSPQTPISRFHFLLTAPPTISPPRASFNWVPRKLNPLNDGGRPSSTESVGCLDVRKIFSENLSSIFVRLCLGPARKGSGGKLGRGIVSNRRDNSCCLWVWFGNHGPWAPPTMNYHHL